MRRKIPLACYCSSLEQYFLDSAGHGSHAARKSTCRVSTRHSAGSSGVGAEHNYSAAESAIADARDTLVRATNRHGSHRRPDATPHHPGGGGPGAEEQSSDVDVPPAVPGLEPGDAGSEIGVLPADLAADLTAVGGNQASRIAAGNLKFPRLLDRAAGGLTLSQLIYDFGQTSNMVATAALRAKAANMNTFATANQVKLAVDQSFYNALQNHALLKVAQVTVQRSGKLVSDPDHHPIYRTNCARNSTSALPMPTWPKPTCCCSTRKTTIRPLFPVSRRFSAIPRSSHLNWLRRKPQLTPPARRRQSTGGRGVQQPPGDRRPGATSSGGTPLPEGRA